MSRGRPRSFAILGMVFVALVTLGASSGRAGQVAETCEAPDPAYHLPSRPDAFQLIESRAEGGAFVMLNLYRLREFADYSMFPELASEEPLSGAEAFEQLAASTDAELAGVGAEVIFRGEGGAWFIGPPCERWDIVQLVRYPSYEAFFEFSGKEAVLSSIPHRFAVLEDSRVAALSPTGCGRPPFSESPPAHAVSVAMYASIRCRIDELLGIVQAEVPPGRVADKLLNLLENTREKTAAAEAGAPAGSERAVKTALAKATKTLGKFRKQVRSPKVLREIDEATQALLVAPVGVLKADLKTLRLTGAP